MFFEVRGFFFGIFLDSGGGREAFFLYFMVFVRRKLVMDGVGVGYGGVKLAEFRGRLGESVCMGVVYVVFCRVVYGFGMERIVRYGCFDVRYLRWYVER